MICPAPPSSPTTNGTLLQAGHSYGPICPTGQPASGCPDATVDHVVMSAGRKEVVVTMANPQDKMALVLLLSASPLLKEARNLFNISLAFPVDLAFFSYMHYTVYVRRVLLLTVRHLVRTS